MSLKNTYKLIRADMQRRCEYEHKKLTLLRVIRFCFYSSTVSIALFRLQVWCHHNYLRPIAFLLNSFNQLFFTVKIDSSAQIGPGFIVLHASYINIGPGVHIGENCILSHQNTITHEQTFQADVVDKLSPQIGSNLFMGAGAVISGAITVGNHVQVSANALVNKTVPDHAVLFGVPARNVSRNKADT
jgi:serine O-acetyltransferase